MDKLNTLSSHFRGLSMLKLRQADQFAYLLIHQAIMIMALPFTLPMFSNRVTGLMVVPSTCINSSHQHTRNSINIIRYFVFFSQITKQEEQHLIHTFRVINIFPVQIAILSSQN